MRALPVYLSQRQIYAKNGSDWVTRRRRWCEERAAPGDGVYFAPRYALTGGPIQQTTRGVAVAYPDAVQRPGRPDPGDHPGGRRQPHRVLPAVGRQRCRNWPACTMVWVIQRVDYDPEYAAADRATLGRGRLHRGAEVWQRAAQRGRPLHPQLSAD